MQHLIYSLLSLGIAYLLGSFPTGYIAGRLVSNIDLREKGSGSTGATNVLRYVGKFPAFIVLLIDIGKGIAAVYLAKSLLFNDIFQIACGLAALTGHIWPVWLRWKGGKAVATGLGMLIGISWPVGLASLGIFLTVLSFTRIVSLSSVISAVCLPFLMAISLKGIFFSSSYFGFSIIAMALVVWRHRSNVHRLIEGTEPKLGQKK